MLDEGGVVLVRGRGEEPSPIVFGHAIYERLVCDGQVTLWAATVRAPTENASDSPQARIELADATLQALLGSSAEIERDDLGSYHLVGSA
jgi:hypothetical protein